VAAQPQQGEGQGPDRESERERGAEAVEERGPGGRESEARGGEQEAGEERDRIVVRHDGRSSRTTDTRMVIGVWWRATSYPADTQVRGFPSRRSSVE